jgi:hypothetical protein
MDIDLSGKTVTQALSLFSSSLEELAEKPQDSPENTKTAVFRLDNETVKLNILQHAAKHQIKCHSRRKGLFWFVKATVPVTDPPDRDEPASGKTIIPNAPRVFNEWWVIQSDQAGQKDHALGHQLQLELIHKLLSLPVGIYFVHRGILLFRDPTLREAAGKHGPAGLWACPKSLDFYQVDMPFLSRRNYSDFLIDHRKSKLIFT